MSALHNGANVAPKPRGPRAPGLRIATHNIRGGLSRSDTDGYRRLHDLVKTWSCELNAHVVCVQETWLVSTADEHNAQRELSLAAHQLDVPAYVAHWSSYTQRPHGSRPQAGVGILIRSDLLSSGRLRLLSPFTVHHLGRAGVVQRDHHGRFAAVRCAWGGHTFAVATCYVPSGASNRYLQQRAFLTSTVQPWLTAMPSRTCPVLAGDFNFVHDQSMDRMRPMRAQHCSVEAVTAKSMAELCQQHALVDAFRTLHPERRGYTLYTQTSTGVAASRLDRIYLSRTLLPCTLSCSLGAWAGTRTSAIAAGRRYLSDHRVLVAHIHASAVPADDVGPGVPRLRLSAFRNPAAKDQLRAAVQQCILANPAPPVADPQAVLAWWPALKLSLVKAVRKAAAEARQALRAPAVLTTRHMMTAAADAAQSRGGTQHHEAAVAARVAHHAALRAAAVPPHLASRWQWLHVRERPSPLMSSLLGGPVSGRHIPCLRCPNGMVLRRGPAMAEQAVGAFAAVSKAHVPDAASTEAVLDAVRTHAVDTGHQVPPQRAAAAGDPAVSLAEVSAALRRTASGRSPGLDGIPAELWRWCLDDLGPLLALVFSAIGTLGSMPDGFNDGVVVPIFKKGCVRDIGNYRPITLLNSDYRILAKCLATRWGRALASCVGPEQTAFLPGRRIGDTVHLLQLLPAALRAAGQQGAAVFLDFQKAYDTVDRAFLYAVMAALGAGGGMLAWARTLLTDTLAIAVVNGHGSQPRRWYAGVRQGCPLAPAMYLFVGWALSIWLHAQPNLGITVGQCRLVLGQYADDTTTLLRACTESALADLITSMDTFGSASGQRLNLPKCAILPLGLPAQLAVPLPTALCGIPVVPSASTLGLRFSDTSAPSRRVSEVDWSQALTTVRAAYRRLAALPLSVFGRGYGASGYGVSTLLYHAEFSDPPPPVLQELTSLSARLVDRGSAPGARLRPGQRLPGVPTELLFGSPLNGGFGLLPWAEHITARHARWAVRFLHRVTADADCQPPGPWVHLAAATLQAVAVAAHPALLLLMVQPTDLPVGPLQRWARAVQQLGLPTRPAVWLTPAGPWCVDQPLWYNPLLCLERPYSARPAAYQQVVTGAAATSSCAATGFSHLALVPGLCTVGDLVAVVWRLNAAVNQQPRFAQDGWSGTRDAFLQCLVPGGDMRASSYPAALQVLLFDLSAFLEQLRCQLWQALPATWRAAAASALRAAGRTLVGPLPGALQRGVQFLLVDATWAPAVPPADTALALAAGAVDCMGGEVLPAEAQHPTVPLAAGVTVAALTRSLRVRATSDTRAAWLGCIVAVHRLGFAARPVSMRLALDAVGTVRLSVVVRAPTVATVLKDLGRLHVRLGYAWRLPWDNGWKEVWWRLLVNGVSGAGGHGAVVDRPCACGWHWRAAGWVGADAAAAVRAHVFWECPVAVAVRGCLQRNLPPGVVLEPRHLWLLMPPAGVHPGVWLVAALSALSALADARRFMAALQVQALVPVQRAVQRAPQLPRGRQLTLQTAWRLPGAAPAVCAPLPVRPSVILRGQREALVRLHAAVKDFVAQGMVPEQWQRGWVVPPDHPFLGVVSRGSVPHPALCCNLIMDLPP